MAIPASAKALFAKYKPEQIREMLADLQKEELKQKASEMIDALDAAHKTLGEDFTQALANWCNENNLSTALKKVLQVDSAARKTWVMDYFAANAKDGKVNGKKFLAAHKEAFGSAVIGYLMRDKKTVIQKVGTDYKLVDDAEEEDT